MRIASWKIAAPCWALALVASWQFLGIASAEEIAPQPSSVAAEKIVVVQPGVTQGPPRLLYALDSGQMSVSELRPGTMDRNQLGVYLSMLDAPIDRLEAMKDPTLVLVAVLTQDAGGEGGSVIQTAAALMEPSDFMPRAHMGVDGVWEFPRLPGTDERELLGFDKWRVVESAESQELFLGPDRQFGFDDFLDIVNPLQHIPLVNIAYRAMSGDKIYGAARLFDAGFGPAAGVSAVVDLALTSTTGESMEDRAVAALFGREDEAENMAQIVAPESQQLADRRLRRGSNQ